MTVSAFDLFKIGVGPSSSHTMGPMTAAADFARETLATPAASPVAQVRVDLYGSLALTGKGHATDRAVLLGLAGCRPDSVDPDEADRLVDTIRSGGKIRLGGAVDIGFDEDRDLLYHPRERMPFHPNAMRCTAIGSDGGNVLTRLYYSIGGGAVVDGEMAGRNMQADASAAIPYPFASGAELLEMARESGLGIADLARANESALRPEAEVRERLWAIGEAMNACIDRGMATGGTLPGGLRVSRRAPAVRKHLIDRQERALADPLSVLDWVNLWALAVNEENAAGGRVVTAPTNGAAGIVPAVLRYYLRFVPGAGPEGVEKFLLTAAAIGSLFKENASISGAEVGCQGEVGVACSMAAAGLTAVLGGSNAQIENAAEIGMEHNLGLTCDPVAGLVQVPCIERNAVGAVKAIEATRLALIGDGTHRVSLDEVIETMRRTGADMNERYKETSLGGLAVSVVEC